MVTSNYSISQLNTEITEYYSYLQVTIAYLFINSVILFSIRHNNYKVFVYAQHPAIFKYCPLA